MSSSHAASTFRPVRPAGAPDQNSQPPQRQEKRKITAVACLSCQRKRCKCDGKRPQCSACVSAGVTTECVYETRGNQSRAEALKEMNRELKDENLRLRELLQTAGSNKKLGGSQPDLLSPQRVVGREKSYETSTGFDHDTESKTMTEIMTTEELNGLLGLQAQSPMLTELSPHLGALHSSMSQLADTSVPRSGQPFTDPHERLQRKVARLEEEVEQLKAAVWQRPSNDSQNFLRLNSTGHKSTPALHGYGTIDPSHIEMEPHGNRHIPSSYGPFVSTTPYPNYSATTTASSLLPPPDATSFTLPNTEASSRISSPAQGLRRRRNSEQEFQRYAHKRQRFGGILSLFGNLPLSSAIWANHQPLPIQQAQIRSLELPIYLLQILNSEDHCLAEDSNVLSPEFASSTFHRFRTYGRRLIANDANSEDVLGPNTIDVQQFFNHDQYILNNHTTSTFAPWFLRAYPSMSLSSKVASALLIQWLLRWQICPTAEHFEAIPEWFRATGCQMFIPHISAFDFIPWPEIRDVLIVEGKVPERQVLIMIISNLVILWPHSTEDIFTWDYASGTAIGVSPNFVEHIHDIENWAVNDKILKHFPYLEGKARFVDIHADLEQFANQSDHRHGGGKQS